MKKLALILITLGILTQTLFCDSNKKDVLTKQASRYTAQRNYEKANEIYLDLLDEYPEDFQFAEKLIYNYLAATRYDEAEELLNSNKNNMPTDSFFNLELRILLAKHKTKEAEKIADKFLAENKGRIQVYKNVSRVFETYRQYEKSVEILLAGRTVAKDKNLFANELGLAYMNLKEYPEAIVEFITNLKNNKSYFYVVKRHLKTILKENNDLIKVVEEQAKDSDDEKVIELYGYALAEIEDYHKALEIYAELPAASLKNFATDMQKKKQYEVSLQALDLYIEKTGDPGLKADVKISIAKILLEKDDFEKAKLILLEVYNDEKLQSRTVRYKTKANKQSRQLLAKIALIQQAGDKAVLDYLKDAMDKSYSERDKDEIRFEIIDYQVNSEKFNLAINGVNEIQASADSSSQTYRTANYYGFMINLMQGEARADTLLSELLVTLPESELTNNALQLAVIAGGFNDTAKEALFSGVRKMNLQQSEAAINFLLEVNEKEPNEELYFLAGEWAVLAGNRELAETIFAHPFTNEVLSDYAKLRQVELIENNENQDTLIRDFLTEHHQSVFAPAFRILMEL